MNLAAMEKWRDEKIAVLSPVAWRTPPERYGAWETVASNITEGLVARGWDVTLFATVDSITKARLHAVVPKGYEEDPGADAKVAEYLHLSEMFEHADDFDLIHSHYDFMALSFSKLVRLPSSRPSTDFPLRKSCRSTKNTGTATSSRSANPTGPED